MYQLHCFLKSLSPKKIFIKKHYLCNDIQKKGLDDENT